jgi:hypothetical protein
MKTATPTSRKMIARTTETTPPLEPTAWATLRSIDASQPGSLSASSPTVELRYPGARTGAWSSR